MRVDFTCWNFWYFHALHDSSSSLSRSATVQHLQLFSNGVKRRDAYLAQEGNFSVVYWTHGWARLRWIDLLEGKSNPLQIKSSNFQLLSLFTSFLYTTFTIYCFALIFSMWDFSLAPLKCRCMTFDFKFLCDSMITCHIFKRLFLT